MKNSYIIYGKHAVLAALNNPKRKIVELLATTESTKFLPAHTKFTPTTNIELKTLTNNSPHQGLVAKVLPVILHNVPQSISNHPKCKIMILDQVTDPHNLGAILRSAAAFGINAVICPKHGCASENGAVAKAACGGLDIVPLIEATNISTTLLELKKEGFWAIGMDGTAEQPISHAQNLFSGKLAVVMGSEGAGIRPLVLKTCDVIAKLPIHSSMESLNVSNAAAIVMWEVNKH